MSLPAGSRNPPPTRSAGSLTKPGRFRQGFEVDRDQPHIFHRDYLVLRAIRDAVREFAARLGGDLNGRVVLDFGAEDCPYRGAFEKHGGEVVAADVPTAGPLAAGDSQVIPIRPDGTIDQPDGSFDFLLSTQVLEHVPEPMTYLREAFRLLRPGGRMLLTTHGTFIYHGHPHDYRRWTHQGLRYECESVGFRVERIDPKVGLPAMATHFYGIVLGSLLRRLPILRHVRPALYLTMNALMLAQETLTPHELMMSSPEIFVVEAYKPT